VGEDDCSEMLLSGTVLLPVDTESWALTIVAKQMMSTEKNAH
jgi:hypothetical protein